MMSIFYYVPFTSTIIHLCPLHFLAWNLSCWIFTLLSQLLFWATLPDTSSLMLLFFTFLYLFASKCLLLAACHCFFNPKCLSFHCDFNLFTFTVIPTILKSIPAIFSHLCRVWSVEYDHNLWGHSNSSNIWILYNQDRSPETNPNKYIWW